MAKLNDWYETAREDTSLVLYPIAPKPVRTSTELSEAHLPSYLVTTLGRIKETD